MTMKSARPTTASKNVVDQLRADIRSGLIAPGTPLRQNDVAARLGVSSTPVREAFRILQTEGLVTLDPHRGVVVFEPTLEDLTECYDMRGVLEAQAIAEAIPRMTDSDLARLEGLLDRMDVTADHLEWVALNTEFHSTVYSLSGRPRLCSVIESLTDLTSGYMRIVVEEARTSGRGAAEHREILEACVARDVERAQDAIRDHLAHTVRATHELLDRDEVKPLQTAR